MKNFRKGVSLAILGMLLAAATHVSPSAHAQAISHDISITADGFVPDYLEVTVGDRVYWWNEDYDLFYFHSTHSYSYPWNSGAIDVNYGVYLDTSKTGSYDYIDDVGFGGTGTLVIKPVGPPPPPPPSVIAAPSRVDMVYDAGRDVVYITSGTNVLRYQLSAGTFLAPFSLGGSLMGIDLSPDGNTLLVADSSANTNVWVYKINLTTEQIIKVNFPAAFYESGTFAIAFGGDGAALITSRFAGSGWVPLRRYDPLTGLATTIASPRHDSMVSSSGDLTTIFLAESDISSGPFSRYDVGQKAFLKSGGDGSFNYECAVSRDASLYSVSASSGTFIYNANFTQITNAGTLAGAQPIGAAFHPAADVVFFALAGTTLVKAYNTTTWQLLAQYDFQTSFTAPGTHAFNNGRIRISPDGQIIFVTVNGGVAYLRHNLDVPLTHRLQVTGNPAPMGSPSPIPYGTYWLAHGTNLSITAPSFAPTNGGAFLYSGWTGSGSAAGSGADTTVNFSLTANSTLTLNWIPFIVGESLDSTPGANQIVLRWPSMVGKSYDILFATSLGGTFNPVITDIPATPPNNTYSIPITPGATRFYKVQMK